MPTIAEAGYPGALYVSWYGIYVPSATPDAIVEKIHDGINKALENPDVQKQLVDRRHPGQADATERTRRADEGRLREADDGGEGLGNDGAVK